MKPTFTIHQAIRLTAYAVTEGMNFKCSDRAADGTMVGGHMTPFDQAWRSHLVLLTDMINKGDINAHSRLTRVPVNKLGVSVGIYDQDVYELTFDGFAKYCAELGLDPHSTAGLEVASNNTPQPKDDSSEQQQERSEPKAPLRSAQQEDVILAAMAELGIDPLQYRDGAAGKAGNKDHLCKLVRRGSSRKLFQSDNVFDKAWDRLRASGRIKDALRQTPSAGKVGGRRNLSEG